MARIVVLPNGKPCSLKVYMYGWRVCHALIKEGNGHTLLAGFGDWPQKACDILKAIQEGVDDRVNIRSGLKMRDVDPYKRLWKRITAGKVTRSCKWCGQTFKPVGLAHTCCSIECGRALRG